MKLSIGAVVRGGTSLAYKTGAWREQRPVLHDDLCKPCGLCEMYCPDSAVHRIHSRYVIDLDFCKGCGVCAAECPAKAIQLQQYEDDQVMAKLDGLFERNS